MCASVFFFWGGGWGGGGERLFEAGRKFTFSGWALNRINTVFYESEHKTQIMQLRGKQTRKFSQSFQQPAQFTASASWTSQT